VTEPDAAAEDLMGRPGIRFRWKIRELMVLILVIGLSMGLLRIRWGLIFALMAGGVVGCGLAPWYACREMHRLDRELSRDRLLTSRTRSLQVAQSYVLVWAAWYFAGVLVTLTGVGAWWLMRPH
jgi:hypothetical protein